MNYTKPVIFLLIVFIICNSLAAQQKDSTIHISDLLQANDKTNTKQIQETHPFRFTTRALIIPLSLITYGGFSQADKDLKEFDVNIKNVVKRDPDFNNPIDNYLQYAPGFAVFALNAAGIKGKSNFRDMTMIYLLSNAMMGLIVQSIKMITRVARPEGFGTNEFPSGHTATGILSMYNNKHWFRDVVAGEGFGILAIDAAYYLEPIIAKKRFHKRPSHHFDPASF